MRTILTLAALLLPALAFAGPDEDARAALALAQATPPKAVQACVVIHSWQDMDAHPDERDYVLRLKNDAGYTVYESENDPAAPPIIGHWTVAVRYPSGAVHFPFDRVYTGAQAKAPAPSQCYCTGRADCSCDGGPDGVTCRCAACKAAKDAPAMVNIDEYLDGKPPGKYTFRMSDGSLRTYTVLPAQQAPPAVYGTPGPGYSSPLPFNFGPQASAFCPPGAST